MPGADAWRDVVKGPLLAEDHPSPASEDLAVIQYTSGTTGSVKGAMLSHRNLFANALQGAAWMKDAEDGKEVIYAVLPMFHAFGMTLYLTFGVLKRARIVLLPKRRHRHDFGCRDEASAHRVLRGSADLSAHCATRSRAWHLAAVGSLLHLRGDGAHR